MMARRIVVLRNMLCLSAWKMSSRRAQMRRYALGDVGTMIAWNAPREYNARWRLVAAGRRSGPDIAHTARQVARDSAQPVLIIATPHRPGIPRAEVLAGGGGLRRGAVAGRVLPGGGRTNQPRRLIEAVVLRERARRHGHGREIRGGAIGWLLAARRWLRHAHHRQELRSVSVWIAGELDEGGGAIADGLPCAAINQRGGGEQCAQRDGAHRQLEVFHQMFERKAARHLNADMRQLA